MGAVEYEGLMPRLRQFAQLLSIVMGVISTCQTSTVALETHIVELARRSDDVQATQLGHGRSGGYAIEPRS